MDISMQSPRPSTTTTTTSAEHSTLLVAIEALKDRCRRQQSQISGLRLEVNAVNDENVRLREKNLHLNQALHRKTKENLELRDKAHETQEQHLLAAEEASSLREKLASAQTSSLAAVPMDDGDCGQEEAELIAMLARHQENLKARILEQQDLLKNTLSQVISNSSTRDASAVLLVTADVDQPMPTAAELSPSPTPAPEVDPRKCPMCELAFATDIKQDEFEKHVMEHFEYEEAETLHNFDLVDDFNSFV